MGNPYPIQVADAGSGVVKLAGEATFTDPANQPGGGSQPAGSDGQIQFNDGGTAFGASPDLAWQGSVGTGTLKLVATENGHAVITANGLGTEITLSGANGDATHVGGEVSITAGTSAGQDGGNVLIAAGGDTGGGTGGNVSIESGDSVGDDSWDGGDIAIRANPGASVGHRGGDINIVAGRGAIGGNVTVQGGGTSGNVQIYSGDGNQALQLDNTGLNVLGKVGFFGGAPVDQPTGVAVSAAAIHAALVSLGLITA